MKDNIRQLLLEKRLSLSKKDRDTYAASLIQKIKAHPLYQKAKVVGLFSPIKNEPDLLPLLKEKKRWLLPKVVGMSLIYVHKDQTTPMIKSSLGILEPEGNQDEASSLDLIIIPGIAFDLKGNRIGFGKGYFDRFLSTQSSKYVIGVAYPFQIIKTIMTTEGDVSVDEVLVA